MLELLKLNQIGKKHFNPD
jgi:aubergine